MLQIELIWLGHISILAYKQFNTAEGPWPGHPHLDQALSEPRSRNSPVKKGDQHAHSALGSLPVSCYTERRLQLFCFIIQDNTLRSELPFYDGNNEACPAFNESSPHKGSDQCTGYQVKNKRSCQTKCGITADFIGSSFCLRESSCVLDYIYRRWPWELYYWISSAVYFLPHIAIFERTGGALMNPVISFIGAWMFFCLFVFVFCLFFFVLVLFFFEIFFI